MWWWLTIGLTLMTVVADVFIKNAAKIGLKIGWMYLLIAGLINAFCVLGWYFVLREVKLSSAGVIYALCTLLMVVGAGVVFFQEKLSISEIIGIILAVVAIFLLAKFV